jgi:hypothetical protein
MGLGDNHFDLRCTVSRILNVHPINPIAVKQYVRIDSDVSILCLSQFRSRFLLQKRVVLHNRWSGLL